MNQAPPPAVPAEESSTTQGDERTEANGAGRATRAVRSRLHAVSRYSVILVWILIVIFFSILEPSFFPTTGNFETIFGSQSVLLILALGVLLPSTTGEFDLSVSGVLGLALVLVGYLNVVHHWAILPACVVAVAAGTLVGVINAFFVVGIGVESLIVTLGTGTALTGVALALVPAAVAPISQSLVNVMGVQLFGLQAAFYYGLGLTILFWYVFTFTPFGKYLYFVGAGREVARLAGLRVNAIRVTALIGSSFIAALAGVVLAGLNGSADPGIGASYLLPAYAAAFLGSTIFHPGRFNPWGTFVAVYFLVTGITGLELHGVQSWVEPVFYGGTLVLAVAGSRIAARHATSAS